MSYVWNGYSLDRARGQLLNDGKRVELSRRVLNCIAHLVEQRHRVVGHDELMRILWGHTNVTQHQLTQVVVAARRAVDDDGQVQRRIRTFAGLGYRWVGEVSEIADSVPSAVATPATTPSPEPNPPAASDLPDALEYPTQPEPPLPAADRADRGQAPAPGRTRKLLFPIAAVLCLALAVSAFLLRQDPLRKLPPGDAAPTSGGAADASRELLAIRESLWRGQHQRAADLLAALPPAMADTQEAKLLGVRLDLGLGRFDSATARLSALEAEPLAAADMGWRVRLLSMRSLVNGAMGKSGVDVLLPARKAVALLESNSAESTPELMGEALLARGYGHMKALDYAPALSDLLLARDLLTSVGRLHDAADAADVLARIHMRSGRYTQALELFEEVGEYSRKSDFTVHEIFARNAITKINIELLRWDDALSSSERSMRLLSEAPDSERRVRVLMLRARALTGVGRLREAQALLEDAEASRDQRYSTITRAAHALAAGDFARSMAAATQAMSFKGYGVNDMLLLESEDGALLLWLAAAQGAAAESGVMAEPTPEQRIRLQSPMSTVGTIARGRWFWSQKEYGPAEVDLRKAFADAREKRHLAHMLAAAEPLVQSLLERGEVAEASDALQELWMHDPDLLERDYGASLLKLRVALASGETSSIQSAYRVCRALAGERALPKDVAKGYARHIAG